MNKRFNIIYISLILLLLIVPLTLTNTEEGFISSIDNRMLVDAPEIGSENYPQAVELYMQDRIGLRNQMIRLYDVINDVVGGELTHPLYSYGRDGYIFLKPANNIEYSDYHKSFTEMVLKMQEYCEDRGTHFYFVFNPEKASVLREQTSKGEHYDDSWVDEMLQDMDKLGINYVDNKELLTRKSLEEEVFNRKYDAGHWNDLGCFYGTNNLLLRIHEDYPEVTELDADEFDITTKLEKCLPNSEFIVNEEVPVFTLKSSYDDRTDQYDTEVDRNDQYRYFHYLKNTGAGAKNLPRMLVFQGSYYNSRQQFLVSRTSDYIAVHSYQNVMDLDYYYNLFYPDIVVFEVAEYTVKDMYFDEERMADIQWNPSLLSESIVQGSKGDMELFLSGEKPAEIQMAVKLLKGQSIDYLFLDRQLDKAEEAYLIINSSIYDLQDIYDRQSNYKKYYTSVISGELEIDSNALLIYADKSGDKHYAWIPVKRAVLKESIPVLSDSATYDEADDCFVLTNNTKGNIFSKVVLQILKGNGKYLKSVEEKTSAGKTHGVFAIDEEGGMFALRLKANSNLDDEWVDYTTELKAGQVYAYSFEVDELKAKQVILKNFIIYK